MRDNRSPFTTALFVPQWWSQLFSETFIHPNKVPFADLLNRVRVLPPLPPSQLKILSQIIASFQQQLLAETSSPTTVTISPPTIYQQLPTLRSLSQHQQVERLIHNLQGLRLLFADSTTTLRSYPLFSDEHWQVDGSDCRLTLTDNAAELLLGYCDPYAELNRCYNDKTAVNVAIDSPPLQLSKSLWLDLQGVEQLLYLRLEKSAQHQANWLNLEHCLALPVDQLLASVTVNDYWQTLSKLGKKLREHGQLAQQSLDSAIFCRGCEKGQAYLSWTLQDFAGNRSRQTLYRDKVARYFFFRRGRSVFTEVVGNFFPDQRRFADKLFSKINEQFDEIKVIDDLSANNLLIDVMLFCEWSLRQADPQGRWPLPAEFDKAEIRTALDNRNSQPLTQRLAVIQDFFDQHPDSLRLLTEHQLASLASPRARANLKKSSPPSLTDTEPPVPETRSADRAHLHKIASLELRKIVTNSPSSYRQLENSYFASLSAEAKESILEVKRHMQASVFENHLRPRLISFMVDNPRAWERTDTVKELRVFD